MTLVDDARQFWRWWSVRVAALAGLITTWVIDQPQQALGLIAYVPAEWRPLAAALAGFAVFGLPTLVRLLKQKGKTNGQP
jgi:hypothetical protein